jgi:broad specificity phosphatase PhoE
MSETDKASGTEPYGQGTTDLINRLFDQGIERVTLLMRHSAREFNPAINDLLNPLTDEGRHLSRNFGDRLPVNLFVKGYASPPDRCMETAQLVLDSLQTKDVTLPPVRPLEGLGVFYAIDQIKMWKGMQAAGGLASYLGEWLAGGLPEHVMISPRYAAVTVMRLLLGKHDIKSDHKKQLDLCVSHDMTVLFVRHYFGLEPVSDASVEFLDGLALYRRDGRLWLESHHGSVSLIDLPDYE